VTTVRNPMRDVVDGVWTVTPASRTGALLYIRVA